MASEFDQANGRWIGLTGNGRQLTISDRAPDRPGGRNSTVDLSTVSSTPLTAVAANTSDGLVWVAGASLYGIDSRGTVARTLALPDGITSAQDMAFAPSTDSTDPASTTSLFMVASPAGATAPMLVELAIEPLAALAATVEATLVRTTDLSVIGPPAPDSSGIAYLPGEDRLMIGDSEVEEMAIYAGVNLWKITRLGAVIDTGTTSPALSDEPTGLSYKASSNTLLVSDDDKDRVTRDNPGVDGRFGTGDDSTSYFTTTSTGNGDCEDLTYYPDADHVFTVDGVNKEVYRYQMSNGALVSQFDVGAYGALDPEGIAYDATTNSLFVLDGASDAIYNVDLTGNLIQVIGLGAANGVKPAGIAVAPASNGSGQRNLYIVQRGIDNDGNPTENDGAMYEMSIPGGGPVNQAPVVNAGADQTITLPAGATLSGTATDDGLPSGSTLTSTWTKQSGPGTVTFANASAPNTTATFSSGGIYVIRLTSSDTERSSFDEVQITVIDPNGPTAFSVAVNASNDDAEENNTTGNVNRSSADLELVQDGATLNQTVGMRFNGVAVPPTATITNAYIQFTVDEVKTAAASLTIRGEKSLNPGTYTSVAFNVSARPDTAASVPWSPAPWPTLEAAGNDQRTPNLAAIVQEVIGQPGWTAGNSVALTVVGSGVRTAHSFDFGSGAPVLVIEYTFGPPTNQAPIVNAGADQTIVFPAGTTLSGAATDDGLPSGSTLTTTWSQLSGPGTVTFANASSPATTATFSQSGVYTLQLSATDSLLTTNDTVVITVNPTGTDEPGADRERRHRPDDHPPRLGHAVGLRQRRRPAVRHPHPHMVAARADRPRHLRQRLGTDHHRHVPSIGHLHAAADRERHGTEQLRRRGDHGQSGATDQPGADRERRRRTRPSNCRARCRCRALPAMTACPPAPRSRGCGPKLSGPGTVAFADASALATTASFSSRAVYTLRLTASDSVLSSNSDVIITVNAAAGSNTLTVSVGAVSDDAEENNATHLVDLKSSDLEIVTDGTKVQTIGLRFASVNLPANATVVNAYIQFSTNRARSGAVSIDVRGVLQANPTTFTTAAFNVSGRPQSATSVGWAPATWTIVGEAGVNQRTPNLKALVDLIRSTPGFAAGNAMAFTLAGPGGVRQANSFGFGQAASLVIEYNVP